MGSKKLWMVLPTTKLFNHLFSSEYSRFDRHTPESYDENVAELRRLAAAAANGTGTNAQLTAYEKSSGIKYDPDSLLFDDECRRDNL